MNTSIYIAKRYLFSRKKMHAVNIISGISMFAVLIASAALVIILSVFNGLEEVILSLYSNFTSELKIEPKEGKTFDPNTTYFKAISRDPKVQSFVYVLQEKALIRYQNRQFIGTVMGVSDDFLKGRNLDSTIDDGSFTLKTDGKHYAVIGRNVQGNLAVNINDPLVYLQVFSPRRSASISVNPLNEFVVRDIGVSGVFSIQQDFDNIMVTPIEFTRDLLDEPQNVSSIEINYKPGTDVDDAQSNLEDKIGHLYTIKNRSEQNTLLYKTLRTERWAVFLILIFVLIIATFNIIGSLTMLVIDKKKDIAILTGLGANKRLIQGIFFFEGMMISLLGCVVGMAIGFVFCLLQQKYGMVKMTGDSMVIDAYPIAIKIKDFILVFLTVTTVAVIASGISARVSVKGLDEIKQDL